MHAAKCSKNQKRIQKLVEHLRWSFLRKQLTAKAINHFRKRLCYMFGLVLSTPLKLRKNSQKYCFVSQGFFVRPHKIRKFLRFYWSCGNPYTNSLNIHVIYFLFFRSNPPGAVLYKKFFKFFFLQNSQENTCATVFPGPILIYTGSV